jgi:hypothetical protein
MQVQIINGIYGSGEGDFRATYPVNMFPVMQKQPASAGFLRVADGITAFGIGPGVDRGGINWNDICYRVMGSKLVSISNTGTTTTLADVVAGSPVAMDYSFDRLGIASNGSLYYWNGSTLSAAVSGTGTVVDMIWVDGYWMVTDGTYLIVTELNDPTSINPLKYGSSEADPDPIIALLKLHNEPHALNRYTIESFNNIGGEFFPFERIDSAQIQKGVVGTHACCIFLDNIAFLGGGRNEAVGVYLGSNSQVTKLSTRTVDRIFENYTAAQIAAVKLESRIYRDHSLLLVHLPDRALVYDAGASGNMGEPVWYILTTTATADSFSQYLAKNLVFCYGKWLCADPTSTTHGYLTESVHTHYGNTVRWEFQTPIIYGEGSGFICHEMELVGTKGAVGANGTISTSWSIDGSTWSSAKPVAATGSKRAIWRKQGYVRSWRVQKFTGDSTVVFSPARLEIRVEEAPR